MKPIKIALMLALSVGLVIFSRPILSTDSADGVDGEFNSQGFNNPVEIEDFRMFEVDQSTRTAIQSGTSLQPQKTYAFTVDVFDFDGVNDIERLEIRLFYTASGSSIQTRFESADTTPDTGEAMVLRFQNDADNGGTFSLITEAGVSWKLGNQTVPAVGITDQAFTFEVEFEVSKVATFSEDTEWNIGVLVTDGFAAEGADLRTISASAIGLGADPLTTSSTTLNMNWYGEIDVPANARLSWPVLLPGSSFDDANNVTTIPAINYIANGGYARQVNSDYTWTPTRTGITNVPDAKLNVVTSVAIEDTQEPQTFSLSINETDESYDSNPADAKFILTNSISTKEVTSGTSESGVDIRYDVFIALSKNFQNATYEGNVTFTVTNLLEVGS